MLQTTAEEVVHVKTVTRGMVWKKTFRNVSVI